MGTREWLVLIAAAGLMATAVRGEAADGRPAFVPSGTPQLSLSNGVLHALVLLPDAKTGYYRGPRFDWSGLVARVTFQGHTYFGEWKTPHDPEGNDDVVGPADEFGMGYPGIAEPLGYAEAKPGEDFLKIGVGLQQKIEEPAYQYSYDYRITKPGAWKIRHGRGWVEFRQDLSGPRGWGYRYAKKISLTPGRPEMVISHSLRNTGAKPFTTSQYCHNFTTIDDEPIGPSYRLRFAFPLTTKSDLEQRAEVHGRDLTFPRALQPDESVFAELEGFSGRARDNEVIVENLKSHAGVKITGDRPLHEFHFWAVPSAACPEPFLELHLAPGEQVEWQARYTFFVGKAN
jgi:hypothetical protein